jgi:cytochrome P450
MRRDVTRRAALTGGAVLGMGTFLTPELALRSWAVASQDATAPDASFLTADIAASRHGGADTGVSSEPPLPPDTDTPSLDRFDAIAAEGGNPGEVAMKQAAFVRTEIRDNALPFFAELRDHRPVMQAGPFWLVSRFRDVEEIMHRETVFSVPYLPNMNGVIGPFILSQDITPLYDHDVSLMRLAIRRDDMPRIQEIVSRHAVQIVNELASGGQPFDIVQTLTRIVPLRVAQEYFGFQAPDDDMKRWARAAFEEFFVNLDNIPSVREAAIEAGKESRAALAALIAQRRESGERRDDVLGWLLQQQCGGDALGFDDDGVIRTM